MSGCGKDSNTIIITPGDTTKTGQTIIEITVKDADSWTSENSGLTNVSGATVRLFNSLAAVKTNHADGTGTTDSKGVVLVKVSGAGDYYFTVSKGDATNIYSGYLINKVYINNSELAGAEINQPTPAVGWPKVTDLNGDGTISANDEQNADMVTATANKTVKRVLYVAKPIAPKIIEVSNPIYPETKPSMQLPGQCYGTLVMDFTCPEKFWSNADQTLLFIDIEKTMYKTNGVVILTGTGDGYSLTGKLNAGTATPEGKTLTFSNIVARNGVITGKVSALIEPGSCSSEVNYLDTYVFDLKAALCFTTFNNVIHATAGESYIKGSTDINYSR
ncbi:MAG: hypothetical protein ABIN95_06525 [Mucilaginibacter sp.]